jgi:hypothetical protein
MIDGWTAMENRRRSDSSPRGARARRGDSTGLARGARVAGGFGVGLGDSSGGGEALAALGLGAAGSGSVSRRSSAWSSTSGSPANRGTDSGLPQPGQRTFRPANSSLTRSDRPQSQVTWMGMDRSRVRGAVGDYRPYGARPTLSLTGPVRKSGKVGLSAIAQQRLHDLRCQTLRLGVSADLVHDFLQRPGRACGQLAEAEAEEELHLAALLGGSCREGASGVRIDFQRNCCCCHDSLRLLYGANNAVGRGPSLAASCAIVSGPGSRSSQHLAHHHPPRLARLPVHPCQQGQHLAREFQLLGPLLVVGELA